MNNTIFTNALRFIGLLFLQVFVLKNITYASASVLTAFIRPFVLAALEPRGGYGVNHSPTKFRFGFNFFFSYSCILMFAHLLVYFSMEIFTPVYLGEIFLRTVFSFLVSMIFVIIYQFLLNPRD